MGVLDTIICRICQKNAETFMTIFWTNAIVFFYHFSAPINTSPFLTDYRIMMDLRLNIQVKLRRLHDPNIVFSQTTAMIEFTEPAKWMMLHHQTPKLINRCSVIKIIPVESRSKSSYKNFHKSKITSSS